MILLILIAALVSSIIYVLNKEITTKEYIIMLISTISGVLLVWGIFSLPIANDKMFQSGAIWQTTYHPYFVEEYKQPHTMCTSSGKSTVCTTYYTTEREVYKDKWSVWDTLDQTWYINQNYHNKIKQDFGNQVTVTKPNKCKHGGKIVKGDPNLYTYWNKTQSYKYPTNKVIGWHNKLKQKSNVFKRNTDYKKPYPKQINIEKTNRLLQKENGLTEYDWDVLNSRLYGNANKVNLILTKIENAEEAKKLEDAWINGKKNDLVICIEGSYKEPKFVKVFGWSSQAIVKRKLESYILDNGIGKDNLDEIYEIVVNDYNPYDFDRFKYLVLTPPFYIVLLAFIVACIIGAICYEIFNNNWENKDNEGQIDPYNYNRYYY